jgi:hypothetical protein
MATDLQSCCGVFKRVLASRLFDTLAPAPDSNAIVCIDRVPEEVVERRRGVSAKRDRWSFGSSVEAARTGYIVEELPATLTAGSAWPPAWLVLQRPHKSP